MQCEYCHLTGHTKDNCYKLIGYPNDWKQRKKGEYSGGNGGNYKGGKSLASVNHGGYEVQVESSSQRLFTSANNVSGKHEDPGQIASTSHASCSHEVNNAYVEKGHGFTEEEYKQILGLLHKDQDPEASYNMTGNATCLTRNCFSEEWIVDSGASHHIASKEHLLTAIDRCTSKKDQVNLPTGAKVNVSYVGNAPIFEKDIVKNVLFVPDFRFNLLSVSKITRVLSCFVSFYPDFCVFQDLHSGKVKGIGKENGGLYIFRNKIALSKQTNSKKAAHQKSQTQTLVAAVTDQDCKLWHRRLGHASAQAMKHLKLLHNNKEDELLNKCSICPLAKQTRLSFPTSSSRANLPFELVHMDLWGPYRTPTFDKKQYFLTVVDDYSRFTWVHLLQLKSETLVAVKHFLIMIKTQFNAHVKVVRSDNGTEFFNSQCMSMFQDLGIIHQSSCVHTPQQNGVVERKNRHILNVAKAIRFESHMPLKYWGKCVVAAVYLLNRSPSSALNVKIPYEVLYSKPPSLSHLRVIGCLCYASTVPKGDKFAERAKPAILMGYSDTQKGYLLLDLHTKQFFVSRDVIFKEHVFPFAL